MEKCSGNKPTIWSRWTRLGRRFRSSSRSKSAELKVPDRHLSRVQRPRRAARTMGERVRSARGAAYGLAAAALFGASAPLTKLLLPQSSPLMLAGLFYLGAGLALTLYRTARP